MAKRRQRDSGRSNTRDQNGGRDDETARERIRSLRFSINRTVKVSLITLSSALLCFRKDLKLQDLDLSEGVLLTEVIENRW